jgi:hypothetical protein
MLSGLSILFPIAYPKSCWPTFIVNFDARQATDRGDALAVEKLRWHEAKEDHSQVKWRCFREKKI